MNETLNTHEEFERGISYEAICEAISTEMAWHTTLADEVGIDTELGQEHIASRKLLADARRYLTPSNPEMLHVADLLLQSTVSYRRQERPAA